MSIKTLLQFFNFRRRQKPCVLLIDDFVPDPAIGAGAPRCFELLRALVAAGARTSMFPTHALTGRTDEIKLRLPTVTFYTGGPPDALAQFLRDQHQAFDVIIISRPHNANSFNAARSCDPAIADGKFIIYDAEAIFAERELQQRQMMMQPVSAEESAQRIGAEIALAHGSHMVIAVTEQNAAHFRAAGHRDVRVLGHAMQPAFSRTPHAERTDLLFVGPTYADDRPNSDAVFWFVDRVLPHIRDSLYWDIPLSLVGTSNAPGIAERADGRIDLRGMVPDLREPYDHARVFVAPTRCAAGVPLKIYDAAAHGVPCVVTPLLAVQLGWEHDRDLLVAETPEDFARQCLNLYNDAVLWARIRHAAFARVMRECSAERFDRDVADILHRRTSPRRLR